MIDDKPLEYLDLNKNDPEEYPGKLILWNGQLFIIGRYIATGLESIVHRLLHKESGSFDFVVKIKRFPEQYRAEHSLDGVMRSISPVVLQTALLEVPGGIIEIQLAAVGGSVAFQDLIEKAAGLHSEPVKAIDVYKEILKNDPRHLTAIFNIGALFTSIGEYSSAFQFFARAVAVDPYDLDSRMAAMKCATACAYCLAAINIFKSTKNLFPEAEDLDTTGIDIYLLFGRPEAALEVLERSRTLDASEVNSTQAIVERDISLKKKANALLDAGQVGSPADGPRIPSLEALQQAYQIYDKDPVLAVNYALALRREGHYEEAVRILLSLVNCFSHYHGVCCVFNAAFGKIYAKDYGEACNLLEHGVKMLIPSGSTSVSDINVVDIPGVAKFAFSIGGDDGVLGWLEERKEVALALLEEAASSIPDRSGAINFLLRAYREIPEHEQSGE